MILGYASLMDPRKTKASCSSSTKQRTAPPNQPPTSEFINSHRRTEQFNDPCRLPPVGCKLVIKVGDAEMIATRTGYIADRNDAMEYKLEATGELISGRFWWSYP